MISLVSDSHIPNRAAEIPEEFLEIMDEASAVVHCGDFEDERLYHSLNQRFDDFYAVKGNCDYFEIPVSETFEYQEVSFGVYHGAGIRPRGHKPTLVRFADEEFGVQVLLHGHTHKQEAVEEDGVLLLNPGSCTGVGGGSSRHGDPRMMTLEVEEGSVLVNLLVLRNGEIGQETERFEIA